MVAKTYQKFPTVGEPYKKNGRSYILIEKPDHTTKEVRFYTRLEYEKMYGEKVPSPYDKTLDEVLGFHDGRIIIFDGYTEDDTHFFAQNGCTFHSRIGWSLAGNKSLFPLPSHLRAGYLYWEDICDDTKPHLRAGENVIQIVNNIKQKGLSLDN